MSKPISVLSNLNNFFLFLFSGFCSIISNPIPNWLLSNLDSKLLLISFWLNFSTPPKNPDLSKIVFLCLLYKIDLSPKGLYILCSPIAVILLVLFSFSLDNFTLIWLAKSVKSILFNVLVPWDNMDSFIFRRPLESNNLLTSVVDKINFFWFISGWFDIILRNYLNIFIF